MNTPSSTPAPYSKPVNPLAKRTSVVNNRRASGTDDLSSALPPAPAPLTVTLDDGTSLKTLASVSLPTSPLNEETDSPVASASTTQSATRRQSAALADLLDMNTDGNTKSPFDD